MIVLKPENRSVLFKVMISKLKITSQSKKRLLPLPSPVDILISTVATKFRPKN